MARIAKPQHAHHTFRLLDKENELLLVGKGSHAYLWVGPIQDGKAHVLGGQQALRALARAILRNVPPRKPHQRVHGDG